MSLLLLLQGEGIPAVTAEATWEQAQTWEATASERIPSTAAFEQQQTWAAEASESIPGTAAWSQDAAWSAEAQSAEDVTAVASWEQSQSWESTGDVDNPAVPVDAVGTWTQTQTWAALATTPDLTPPRPRIGPPVRVRLHINGAASFAQEPASWHAEMTVVRRDADIEELMLVGAI